MDHMQQDDYQSGMDHMQQDDYQSGMDHMQQDDYQSGMDHMQQDDYINYDNNSSLNYINENYESHDAISCKMVYSMYVMRNNMSIF
ncbi:hypothetical protein PMLGA01_110030200 [Plasmodium malariae]|uniref:Uncharacterized protein n=1 Tax=Plasmodium malariae TaxID=5858 RepID=A0A1C3KZK7_PLAMA|nr:hypothetical protein PMLGA01_110030200 [Plasmodium malariae]